MGYIILVRVPNGAVYAINTGENGAVAEYATPDEAYKFAADNILCKANGYAVVELDI